MLFKPYLVTEILEGRKTATRRLWPRPMAKVGGTYPIQERMFQKKVDCPGFILCTKLYKQYLYEMTEDDARAEGFATFDDFVKGWIKINKSFNPFLEPYVIEFELVVT